VFGFSCLQYYTNTTTDKTSLVKAVNELFTSANNGKTAIANAVNAKGIPATSADTFSVLATKITTPSLVNTADATVIASEMVSGQSGYKNGVKIIGTMPSNASPTTILTIQGSSKVISTGYNPGGTVTVNISNLVAGNIAKDINVGGVVDAGKTIAGDVLISLINQGIITVEQIKDTTYKVEVEKRLNATL
jgi:hypothetical protein